MPSNQQRRDAAKRKLQRQLARRQQRAVAQRRRLTIVGVAAAVLVIAGGAWFVTSFGSDTASGKTGAETTTSATTTATTATTTAPSTPCSYPAAGTPAKPVQPPTNLSPANSGTVDSTVTLNSGAVTIALDRAAAPCAVESFLSLASQHYFDDTPCHRLTTASTLKVLQCGDPTGVGNGRPGYSFADELTGKEKYPAGTVAMANGGADTNGSQFFIVYGDSTLDPKYTVFGKVTKGLDVVQAIAEKGAVKAGKPAQDGEPAEKVTIETVTVPAGSVAATGSYATSPATTSPAAGATSPVADATGESAGTAENGTAKSPGVTTDSPVTTAQSPAPTS